MNREHTSKTLDYLFEPRDVFEVYLVGSKTKKPAAMTVLQGGA